MKLPKFEFKKTHYLIGGSFHRLAYLRHRTS
jgi:hypothetical protein